MTLTPAQQKGFKIGKLYRVFQVTEGAEFHQSTGQIVEFYDDDGSYCPEFTDTNSGKSIYIRLEDLQPYNPATPETTCTIKNLSNQEILLMYVKQYYPEDRVMIAMVESL